MNLNRGGLLLAGTLLVLICIVSARSNAGESRAALCAGQVRGLVKSIDELLSKKAVGLDVYQVKIEEYFPAAGCNVEEVIAISGTSRFFVKASEGYAYHVILFKNSYLKISFSLIKDTGRIEFPSAGWIEQSF